MDHVAILHKKLHLLSKILNGEKTIESRWYKTKKKPFNSISEGDTIYFKESEEPLTIKATVKRVIQFENLTEQKIYDLMHTYEKELSINAEEYYSLIKNKKYGLLIYLDNVTKINPFQIDKKGFGMQAAWISVANIEQIKKN